AMTLMTTVQPDSLRGHLTQMAGVHFEESRADDVYRIFEADLSSCVALAGADAIGYIELKNGSTPLNEHVASLQQFMKTPLTHGRTIIVDSDGAELANKLGSLGSQVVCLTSEELQATRTPQDAALLIRHAMRQGVEPQTLILYRYLGAVTGHRFFGRDTQ